METIKHYGSKGKNALVNLSLRSLDGLKKSIRSIQSENSQDPENLDENPEVEDEEPKVPEPYSPTLLNQEELNELSPKLEGRTPIRIHFIGF